MDLEGKAPLIIISLIAGFILLVVVSVSAFSSQEPPQPPITTPWPTLAATPSPPVENSSTTVIQSNTTIHNDTASNDTSYQALQEQANKGINGQTPNNYSINLTGTGGVDYTGLASMYPWLPDRYNDSSEHPWMWTPAKFYREYNGQGDAQRVQLYQSWQARQHAKAPHIDFQLLHNDDSTPYDFNTEAIVLDRYYDGYIRFTNNGDAPYQGNIAVAINASLFFAGQMVHLENAIITNQYLSLYPGQTNDFYKKWQIKDYGGAPIPTGALNIVIELRDLSDGTTISSQTIKPIVARDPNGDGILTF